MSNHKYPKLSDKEWLEQRYLSENLSTVQIAKLIGCNSASVNRSLKRNGIPIKSSKEAAKTRKRKGFKASDLNNKEWLCQKYVVDNLNTYEIADLIGSNQKSVHQALKFHNIQTRDNSEAKLLHHEKNPAQSKFPKLNDEKWLKEKYVDEQNSSIEIDRMVGCSTGQTLTYLKKYGIPIRSASEASLLVTRESQYDLLNDKDWLYEKYVVEGLGTKKMAKLSGAKTPNSVRQSLIRYGIDVRDISDGLTINREDDNFVIIKDVIEGCLLGDAWLTSYNRSSENSYPYFSKRNIHYEHIFYVSSLLFPKNHLDRIKEEYNKDNIQYSFSLRSLSHKELKAFEKRWYPEWNNYKKVIPEDIEVTSNLLLHWFMDDGSSYIRKRYQNPNWVMRTKQVVNVLCTECFTRDNQLMISKKIKDKFGLDFRVRKYNWKRKDGTPVKGWRMFLPQSQADKFYDVIGPCPVKCFEYKWK